VTGGWKLETGNQKLETRNQKLETRNQKLETRNLKPETRNLRFINKTQQKLQLTLLSMKHINCKLLVLMLMLSAGELMAQKQAQATNDSLAITVAKLTKSMQVLERIKISGFIHAQYQKADTLGAKSFNGGDFADASSQRFLVRRGYLRFEYLGNLATYTVLINANERGVSVLDAYFNIKEPWLKAFSLKGGIFYRPFGYELGYSRILRESPELSRVNQLLFPGERDLGASVTFQLPEPSALHPLKIEGGLFTGNGINPETDDRLDFIGRIGVADAIKKTKMTYGLGFSYYNGSVYHAKKEVYQMGNLEGIPVFRQLLADTIPGNYYKRKYSGIDGQFSIETFLGKSSFRGEFIKGDQPGAEKVTISPVIPIIYNLYLRKFTGTTFFLIQTLPKNRHSIVLKYDFYDPNTEISGDEIGKKATSAKRTNGADIAFTTWGFGWITDFNKNIRLMLYYDLVKNETSKNLSGFTNDQKDNVFTIRVQYKF
jgi:hypothetical protein